MRTRERRSPLDEPGTLAASDPGGMLGLVAGLGDQLVVGYELGRAVGSPRPSMPEGVRSVLVCGMGGSGVAGDVLRAGFADRLTAPVGVGKGYSLPAHAGRGALVIAVSFSGDTEETLACVDEAVRRGCSVVTASAGGRLAALSEAHGLTHVRVPSGVPMPRAALGFLSGIVIGVAEAWAVIPPGAEEVAAAAALLRGLAGELGPSAPAESNRAKSVAEWLHGRTPLVWGTEGLAEAAAVRWKSQMNENAKVPAFVSILPELDHNEVEGWSAGTGAPFGLIILRHKGEGPALSRRVDASLSVIEPAGLAWREVWATGSSVLERLFSLVMVGDFASTYLALLRGVDPMPIPTLTGLKDRLR